MELQMASSFNPQVTDFQPAVAQSHDLPSGQPFIAHNNDPYSDQNAASHHDDVYTNQSTIYQNNGLYHSLPTHSQYNNSQSNSYPGFGLYTAEMHDARNNLNHPGDGPINHTAPHGGFNAADTEPNHSSNAHGHTHGHGHATERQQATYFGHPEGDVEGLIISHNSLGNHNHNHNHAPTEAMVPHDHFVATEVLMPHDSVLARKNAAKAAVLKKDEHKPGKPCPDGHPNCHWHYSRWCHESPVTCRSARKYLRPLVHLMLTDLLLQSRQSPQLSMRTGPGKMPHWAGTRHTSPAYVQLLLSRANSTPNFNVVFTAVPSTSEQGPQRHEVAVAHKSSRDYRPQVTARIIQGHIREDFSQKRKKVKGET
jgi:hypothetical protein